MSCEVRRLAQAFSLFSASNSNHRLKSAVDMTICVLKRGNLCDCMSSRENEARFLLQNVVNLRHRETKWPPTSFCSACICTGSPTQTQNWTCGLPLSTAISVQFLCFVVYVDDVVDEDDDNVEHTMCCLISSGPEPKPEFKRDERTFRLWLDTNQYQQDMAETVHGSEVNSLVFI